MLALVQNQEGINRYLSKGLSKGKRKDIVGIRSNWEMTTRRALKYPKAIFQHLGQTMEVYRAQLG